MQLVQLPMTGPWTALSAMFQVVTVFAQLRVAPMARLRPCHSSESAKVLPDSMPEHSVKKMSLFGYALRTVLCPLGSPP